MGEEFTADERKAILACLQSMVGALERQEAAIQELKFWSRLSRTEQAKEFFEEVLKGNREKWVYEAFDGKATQRIIQEKTRVDQGQISRWGQEWEALGIVVDIGGGKRRKIIPLSALGIDVPSMPKKT